MTNSTKNIRIEEVGDINFDFPYLEVFLRNDTSPFLEIGISKEKQLFFKFYALQVEFLISVDDWEYILTTAKDFLPRVLKNEDDFLHFKEDL